MIQIINHNTLTGIPLDDNSIDCVVTSPPYWGLRDYGADGQLGLEKTPQEYVENMRKVFEDVRRVLKPEGCFFLNLGDSYAANRGGTTPPAQTVAGGVSGFGGIKERRGQKDGYNAARDCTKYGLKHKDLCGIPWRVAFALQDDGWYLRNDIIWHKPNPMPESVTDRCTRAHEYVFHLTKSAKYYYDAAAIAESFTTDPPTRLRDVRVESYASTGRLTPLGGSPRTGYSESGQRNRRTVWTIATQPTPDAHFATYPEKLVEPCILAGCPVGGTVLDPFCGSGTTIKVAERLGRNAIGLELNPAYIEIAQRKTAQSFLDMGVAS